MLNIKINYLPSFRWILILLLLLNFNCSPESTSNDNPGKGTNTVDNSGNISTVNGEKEAHHPFLIVSKELFNSLREKSSVEPWKSMKEDAIYRVSKVPDSNNYGNLQKYVGAAALAYILDYGKS